ncbi:class I SAM-dependent methyltransferase [Candidatus Pelagibacter bacterium]|nr:class I SAM-dependent methyltransferase [Candidatus Pelagibacter bacterium]
MRILHNFFLKDLSIKGLTLDLGSGKNASYMTFMKTEESSIKTVDFFNKSELKLDLEKEMNLEKNKYDTIILFNTLEHIYNYKFLISQISKTLKQNGKFEIFVPFLIGYHPDPNDFFRPTHKYLNDILNECGFDGEVYLIGVGPFISSYQMIFRYLKFSIFKLFFLIIVITLDKLLSLFSKDWMTYYCGTHVSAVKK